MSSNRANPPRLAIWWLRHACPATDHDALTGDLIERFREGQTRGWFWKQVVIAFAGGILVEIRRHWPQFCYAIGGGVVTPLVSSAALIKHLPDWLHWSALAWPWDQLAFELSRPALGALAALSILAVALIIDKSFHWVSLVRTGAINLVLIALGWYSVDLFPWLLIPVPGDPHHKMLRFPLIALLLWFSAFLIAAWLGCTSPRRSDETSSVIG